MANLDEVQTLRHAALWMLGREDEALQGLRSVEAHWETMSARISRCCAPPWRTLVTGALATGFHDPEGLLFCARGLARVQASDFALTLLDQVVDGGCSCSRSLVHDPWFDSLRAEPRFIRVLHRAEAKIADAAAAFAKAGGERLLGVPS